MQENKISVSREILNFLTGVYYEKDKEDIASRKEKIFDRAFYQAYKDGGCCYRQAFEKTAPYHKVLKVFSFRLHHRPDYLISQPGRLMNSLLFYVCQS